MHVVVVVAVVALLYLGLFHTTINRWVILFAVVVISNVAHVAAPGVVAPALLVVEYLALFVVLTVGFAKRKIDAVSHDLDELSVEPAAVRADGVALAEHLESVGFERAPEGWLHFERHGWDAIAMRRNDVNAFMVSGDRGPILELTSMLDDEGVLTTVSFARDRVPRWVLRQCFPDSDADTLLREHGRSLGWLRRAGRATTEVPLAELTERVLTEERDAASTIGRGIVGSMMRELRRQHLDVGTIVDRPDVLRRSRPAR